MTEELKREVRECAREGRQHPDEVVATAALAWARQEVALPRWHVFLIGLIGTTLGLIDGTSLRDIPRWMKDRRAAKRLVKIVPANPLG